MAPLSLEAHTSKKQTFFPDVNFVWCENTQDIQQSKKVPVHYYYLSEIILTKRKTYIQWGLVLIYSDRNILHALYFF